MFTDVFNCTACEKPFDCKEGELRTPFYNKDWCCSCMKKPDDPIRHALIDFLSQPAFKKTENGYEYNWPINDPVCFGCQGNIKLLDNGKAFVAGCGHYLCETCNEKRKKDVIFSCLKCGTQTEASNHCVRDSKLEKFSPIMKEAHRLEMTKRSTELENFKAIEAQKEEARRSGALRDCYDCSVERPVERLYSCNDCKKILCGDCSFDSHHSHAVFKLLGIELDQMEQRIDKKYTENLEGLHGNLKYIQTTIDEAVEKVMKAGKDRLGRIRECTKYEEAQKIVSTVDDAADKFEKHCEVYIPVARQLATRLTELGEELSGGQNK